MHDDWESQQFCDLCTPLNAFDFFFANWILNCYKKWWNMDVESDYLELG